MSRRQSDQEKADSEFRWIEIDLADLLFLVRKHFSLLFFLPLGLAVVAMIYCFALAPVFTSTAVLYLRPNFDREMLIERTFSKLEDADSLRSVEKAIISDTVLLRMINRLGVREDATFLGEPLEPGTVLSDDALLKKVRKRYRTKLLPNTRLVELEVDDFSAARSKVISESLIEEFLRHLGEERDIQQGELRRTLVKQADNALSEALASEKKLEEFRSENPDLIVEQDSSIFQERLLQYSESLNVASAESSSLEGTLVALKGIDMAKDPNQVFQILKERTDEYLAELLGMHAEAKAALASVGQIYTRTHPSYRESQSRLDELEATLRSYAEEMKVGLESEYEAASRREEKLRESLRNLQTEFVAFKSKSAEFRGLQEQIERNWNTYTQLQEKITNLDLNPENEFNFVTLISKPIVPDKKSKPTTKLWMAAAGLLGVITACGLLMFRYREGLPYTTRSQVSEEPDLARATSLNLSKAGKRGELSDDPDILNLAIVTGAAKVIHITSPSPDPEASSVVKAIARALSSQQQRVLIVRLDFEGVVSENQISEIEPSWVSQIHLSPRRLLDPDSFRSGLEKSLLSFDRILIDSTPLNRWDTILATASHADSTFALTRKFSFSRTHYRRFFGLLDHSGAGTLSAILLEGKWKGRGKRKSVLSRSTRQKAVASWTLWKKPLAPAAPRTTGSA
ncbi:MAG: GNVR domain-containing protein [Verrucomicrobiota bacterium]